MFVKNGLRHILWHASMNHDVTEVLAVTAGRTFLKLCTGDDQRLGLTIQHKELTR